MKLSTVSTRVFTLVLALGLGSSAAPAQKSPVGTIDEHIAKARAAAGLDFRELIGVTCDLIRPPAPAARSAATPPAAAPATAPATGPPPRATWHAEPAKVFDNLYFVGQTEYSAWAVTTSAGIILMDAIFDYSVEDEVVGGLTALGLDPTRSSTSSSATRTAITSAAPGSSRSAARASSCRPRTGT